MANVSATQQAKAWLYGALHARTYIASQVDTRIYDSYVPEPPANRVYPYILFNFMGGLDVDGLGTNRIQSQPLFQVRVVDEGRPTAVTRQLDQEIDLALQNAIYQPSGDYYFSARREQPVDRSELDSASGKYYTNLGGLYRLFIGRST